MLINFAIYFTATNNFHTPNNIYLKRLIIYIEVKVFTLLESYSQIRFIRVKDKNISSTNFYDSIEFNAINFKYLQLGMWNEKQ